MTRSNHFFTSLKNNAIAFGLFLLGWGMVSLAFPAYMIPSPLDVFGNLSSYLQPKLVFHLSVTLYRLIVGFACAFVFGTILGIAAFSVHKTPYLSTLMGLFQALPGPIVGVIFLLMFGLGHATPIALTAFLTLPTMAINTANALMKKNALLEEYVHSIGGIRRHVIRYIYLPTLIPTFRSNVNIGIGLALKVVVLGEFIGSQDGIGYLLNLSRIYFNMGEVFFYLCIILLMMAGFQILEHLFFSRFEKYFYPE